MNGMNGTRAGFQRFKLSTSDGKEKCSEESGGSKSTAKAGPAGHDFCVHQGSDWMGGQFVFS
jgi:hypothetical protein